MSARATLLVLSALIAIPTPMSALQQTFTIEGRWEAELRQWDREERIQLNLRMRVDGERSNWGNTHEPDALPELAAALRRGGSADVAFTLSREAGSISFTGTTGGDEAEGDFTWTGSAAFRTAMAGLGYDDLSARDQFSMTLQDVTTAFVGAMHDRGYDVSARELVRFAIFRVTPELVDGLADAGYARVESDLLVKLRIHGVTLAYISEMDRSGYRAGLEEYVRFRIHGLDAEFAAAMAGTFGEEMDADELVKLRIHGIDAEFVSGLEAAGIPDLAMDDALRMKIHGVSPAFMREMSEVGYSGLPADDLVKFRIHGVDADFVRDLEAEGYRDLSPRDLVRARIMGRP